MKRRHWLIIRADGTVRTNAKNPQGRLAIDEIAIPIDVTIPDAWGRVRAAAITVAMPEPPDVIDTSDRPTSEGSFRPGRPRALRGGIVVDEEARSEILRASDGGAS